MKVKRPSLTLLKKIFLVDLIKGLFLTFSYQRPSLNYTEQYPKVRPKVAERFRGAPRLNNDPENGETLCIACNLCALACPEHCIEVGWERDAQGKKALTTYVFDISQTDGDPLPDFATVHGDPSTHLESLKQFVADRGIALEYSESISPGTRCIAGWQDRPIARPFPSGGILHSRTRAGS